MHLKQLKIAGFKSFVDPVVVPFSSQMVAVVGPNGCGKSNIIDAVRWVMGESSAKSLRGDSMVDVIFNGSSNRKALGQASVELVFDNRLGRLGGAYASYQEIAVKRLVTRDGESSYYLNGARCRRRDITEIFLGTGAGARGYSIISQGTISRLIEARPEELRAYLEEAAGVSKYKERRRETVQRMASTRENLARVKDVSDELGKQLVRLERQAAAARQYTLLKQAERQCRADIFALKWQTLSNEQALTTKQLNQLTLTLETHKSQLSGLQTESIHAQEALRAANDALDDITQTFYQLSAEIARLEEISQQRIREKERLQAEKLTVQTSWEKSNCQIQEEKAALQRDQIILEEVLEAMLGLQAKANELHQIYQMHAQQEATWNKAWQEMQLGLAQANRDVEVKQLRLQNLEEKRQAMQLKYEQLQSQDLLHDIETLQFELINLNQLQEESANEQQHTAHNAQEASNQVSLLRQNMQMYEQQLHQAEDAVKATSTRHATLQARQHAALYRRMDDSDTLGAWNKQARLAQLIDVEERWQPIVEWILGDKLYAIVLPAMDELFAVLPNVKSRSALFMRASTAEGLPAPYPKLIEKIQGPIPDALYDLQDVFAANSLEEALLWLPSMTLTQSVVTLDGFWISASWVRISNQKLPGEESLLAQKQALAKLSHTLDEEQRALSHMQALRNQCHAELTMAIEHQEQCKQQAQISQEAKRLMELDIQQKNAALATLSKDAQILHDEQDRLLSALEDISEEMVTLNTQSALAAKEKETYQLKQTELLHNKEHHQHQLLVAQQQSDEAKQRLHECEVHKAQLLVKIEQFKNNITRETLHLDTLQDRLDDVAQAMNEFAKPEMDVRAILDDKLKHHRSLEATRIDAQKKLEELEGMRTEHEQHIQRHILEINRVQDHIQSMELNMQALTIRMSGMAEALSELTLNPEEVLAQLSEEATLGLKEQQLQQLMEKIKRLGAINLVAIEEYESELARKNHLDKQSQDLIDALNVLESAMLKMDRDTEMRFKETFDEVNALFQTLFPRLFGGGRAMLELTCGNLLEAGVLVTAQPPGKRNNTIQLLSGGEKAMTAVALVFAIFKLNPSPFCMLDEVDAPLDDANVRRFCELMQEMSECVQFLFITHNKVTMEKADHLIGVTMREPGVSRVVAVDVEEALFFAQ